MNRDKHIYQFFILSALLLMSYTLMGHGFSDQTTIEIVNPPKDTTVNCQNFKPFPDDIEVIDNCPGDVAVTYFETSTRITDLTSCAFSNYVVTRVFTFSNNCNEIVNYTQVITVIDTIAPFFEVPSDVTVQCSDLNNIDITGFVNPVVDQCGGQAYITYEDAQDSTSLCNTRIERKWTVSDACGNASVKVQNIMVIDTTPPTYNFIPLDETIACNQVANPYHRFNKWLESFGGSVAGNDCNGIISRFAAVPGSYDPEDPSTFPGEYPGTLNDPNCEIGGGIIQQEIVDFVLVDQCGNLNIQSATFNYVDNVDPQIMNCVEVITVNLPSDRCDTLLTIAIPEFTDDCIGGLVDVVVSDKRNLTSLPFGNTLSPVRDIVFILDGYSPEQIFKADSNYFNVRMEFIDANDPGEFFDIITEDGNVVGQTPLVSEQCDNANFILGPFDSETMERWAEDGKIQFVFDTNIDPNNPTNSINLVCPLSSITITNVYQIERPATEPSIFLSINENNPFEVEGLSVSARFSAGLNKVKFIVRDCGGNETFCEKTVEITDEVGPEILCAGDLMFESSGDTCSYPLTLGQLLSISDDCGEESVLTIGILGAMIYNLQGTYEELKDEVIFFPIGMSEVTAAASDFSGNDDICVFEVMVRDVGMPEAICKAINYPVLSIQLDVLTVDPNLLIEDASDNCGVSSVQILDNSFECSDLNTTIGRIVSIQDNSGNQFTCVGNITFSEKDIPVSYSAGICPNDRLEFFLNIPRRPEYSYKWEGPFGFFSAEAEPFIQNVSTSHQGIYTLEITNNSTGCISNATLEVNIEDVRIPDFETETIGCENIPHEVISSPIPGDVTYNWYEEIDGVEYYLESSDSNIHYLSLTPGEHILFVNASNGICISESSNRILVEVREKPVASVCQRIVQGCIGDPLELCVRNPQDGWLYRWSGPNGFTSEEPFPKVSDNYDVSMAGIYRLVIEYDHCISDTLLTTVLSNNKPPKPEILGRSNYCAGDTLVLASSVIGPQFFYVWHSPVGEFKSTEPILRIPNTGSSFGGAWCLTIESGPCTSVASDTLNVFVEVQRNFEINEIPTQCIGAEIKFLPTVIPNGLYSWTGPEGFSSTLISPEVTAVTGNYKVSVLSVNGCIYEDDIDIETVIRPEITGLDISEDGPCIDRNEGVMIVPAFNVVQNLAFDWRGPDIVSADPVLFISNYTTMDNGSYSLTVNNGACTSEPFLFDLDYILNPVTPIIDANPIACVGDSLVIISNTYGASTRFFWNTPLGMVETNINRLVVKDVTKANEGIYSLQVERNGCVSKSSETFSIVVNENLFIPQIISTSGQCVDQPLELTTDLMEDLQLEWQLPNGNIVFSESIAISSAKLSDSGLYRVRSYFNGCPSLWSEYFEVVIEDPRFQISFVEDYIFSCNHQEAIVNLCVIDESNLQGLTYQWYVNEILIGETNTSCLPVQDFSPFSFGVNQVALVLNYKGCEIPFDEVLFVEIENVLNLGLEAGPDQLFCLDQEIFLSADEPVSDKLRGYWTFEQKFEVQDVEDPFTTVIIVDDLASVEMVWNVEHEVCGVVIRDTLVLTQKQGPILINDTITSDNSSIIIPVRENDIFLEGESYSITNISTPLWGDVSNSGDVLTFRPSQNFVGGPITFTYEICENECSTLCDEAEVIVYYKLGSCKGNNVITPNNDGINDLFVIPCIDEQFSPDNELIILNELGNTIYQKSPYDNSWDGTFNGDVLPAGTYYYLFKRDSNTSFIQGFIAIER